MSKIKVQGTEITVISINQNDDISLTDMLKAKDGDFFISDWLRNRNTVEYLRIWEQVHNIYAGLKPAATKPPISDRLRVMLHEAKITA